MASVRRLPAVGSARTLGAAGPSRAILARLDGTGTGSDGRGTINVNAAVRTDLREPTGASATKGTLSEFTVTLEMVLEQARVEEGIHLVIEITNRGGREVELINPLDFLIAGILLYDRMGHGLDLASVPPRLLIHTTGPDRDRLSLPFRLDFIELDSRCLSDTEFEQRTIALSPGARLWIGIAVDRIVVRKETDASTAPPEPMAIPPGQYRVEVSVTLATSTNPEITRILQSPPLTVTLGQR